MQYLIRFNNILIVVGITNKLKIKPINISF
jgi:hypothetical protein